MAAIIQIIKEFDPEVDAGYAFPATTDWVRFSGPSGGGKLFLMTVGDPGSLHNNAPLGSVALDYTNYTLYIMTAAATWTVVGAQS